MWPARAMSPGRGRNRRRLCWLIPELLMIEKWPGVRSATVDWCQYGRQWRKRTRFLGTLAGLDSLTRRCGGGHEHLVLQGNTRDSKGRSVARTSLAAEYSVGFCRAYQALADRSLSLSAARGQRSLRERCELARASTLLSGSQEKGLGQEPLPSPAAPGQIATSASGSRTSPSVATPSGWHL